MKNFIITTSSLNSKENKEKNPKEKSLINKKNLVHYRRDLDSIG